jgi:hypothetical protein
MTIAFIGSATLGALRFYPVFSKNTSASTASLPVTRTSQMWILGGPWAAALFICLCRAKIE